LGEKVGSPETEDLGPETEVRKGEERNFQGFDYKEIRKLNPETQYPETSNKKLISIF